MSLSDRVFDRLCQLFTSLPLQAERMHSPVCCPLSTKQSHVHVRTRHEPCSRSSEEDDGRLGVTGLYLWRVNERLDIAVLFVFRPHRAGAASLQPTHHLLTCLLPSLPVWPYVCARVQCSARTEIAHLHMHSFCICMTRQNDTSWHRLLARSDKRLCWERVHCNH